MASTKSSMKYEQQFVGFNKCKWNKLSILKEEVFLTYFSEESKRYKSPTLWFKYSDLKAICKIKLNLAIG